MKRKSRKGYKGRSARKRTYDVVHLNEKQSQFLKMIEQHPTFLDWLLANNKVYYYTVCKAINENSYLDCKSSKRTLTNVCRLYAKKHGVK